MKIFTKKNRYSIAIVILSILLLLVLNFYQREIKNFFYSISEPIQKGFWRGGEKISNFLETIDKIRDLKKDLDELKLKNQELIGEISRLKELEKENKALREALNIELQKEFKLKLTQVMGKDVSQDSLLIDKGEIDGISEGLPVISQTKILVGRISKVYKNYSQVLLISNRGSNISVKVGEKEIEGLIRGKGNFQILLDFIPLDKEIKSGDTIFTTGREGNLPRGLLVGLVNRVLRNDVEPYQQAEVKPSFDIGEIDFLFVISNY